MSFQLAFAAAPLLSSSCPSSSTARLCSSSRSSSFTYSPSTTRNVRTVLRRRMYHNRNHVMSATPPPSPNRNDKDKDNKDEYHDIPESSIDWNKSWNDFQASGGSSSAPPGREPIPREEIARRKMVNSIRNATDTLPSRQQLFADWRFWLAIILTLSLFTAFVNSTNSTAMPTI